MWSFYAHTVTEFSFPSFRADLTALFIQISKKRFFHNQSVSVQPADKKNADGNTTKNVLVRRRNLEWQFFQEQKLIYIFRLNR